MIVYITILIFISIILIFYALIKLNSRVRKEAYKLFLIAEHIFLETQKGQEKMNYVVSNIYSHLPKIIKVIINEDKIREIIQNMFNEIKDLLDDGKRNKSINGDK